MSESSVRPSIFHRVPLTADTIVEIGVGDGSLAREFLARKPSAKFISVLPPGDGETGLWEGKGRTVDSDHFDAMAALGSFPDSRDVDALVLDESLGRMQAPWIFLAEARQRMRPGGVCVAGIHNIGHWSVVAAQLRGQWRYDEDGVLARDNVRFFSLRSALDMFRDAGWAVTDVHPVYEKPEDARIISTLDAAARKLGAAGEEGQPNLTVAKWVIRAVNGTAPAPLNVMALGLRKAAGVTEARVDYPMAALATVPSVRVVWGAPQVNMPENWKPGVFILHRQFIHEKPFQDRLEQMAARGWMLVSDMDDDPHHWKEYVESDFYAFRGVHAVTVSTEPLAEMIRQWNPNVRVFSNAVYRLPQISPATPKQGERIRVFFGALNRGGDWKALGEAMGGIAAELADKVEFVVVHDRDFYSMLPDTARKEFHPTLPPDKYQTVMASCDIGLLPLEDTKFNRLKSDLKFIECCGAGVVPICSRVVYEQEPRHRQIGVFPASIAGWRHAIVDLCRNPGEIARRRELGLDYVKSFRMHAHQVEAREQFYRSLLADRDLLEKQRRQRLNPGVAKL